MSGDTLPADLARLWRLPQAPPRLGRPAELDVEQVVATAVGLADRDGVAGVTLLKVAQELGFTKMALYRHVGSKDELLELMVDRAIGPAPGDLGTSEGWRAGLHGWAHAMRAVYAAHPWVIQIPISRPPRGPNGVSWIDALLRALRETGLDGRTKLGVAVVLSGYVWYSVALAAQMEEGRRAGGSDQSQAEQEYGRVLHRLIDPERFPDAAALFAGDPFGGPVDGSPSDEDFGFGLDLVLDGIGARVARDGRAREGGPPRTA